jgi:hypothetical protein
MCRFAVFIFAMKQQEEILLKKIFLQNQLLLLNPEN